MDIRSKLVQTSNSEVITAEIDSRHAPLFVSESSTENVNLIDEIREMQNEEYKLSEFICKAMSTN